MPYIRAADSERKAAPGRNSGSGSMYGNASLKRRVHVKAMPVCMSTEYLNCFTAPVRNPAEEAGRVSPGSIIFSWS
jgi:hypothetical protein